MSHNSVSFVSFLYKIRVVWDQNETPKTPLFGLICFVLKKGRPMRSLQKSAKKDAKISLWGLKPQV
jgi:hypothetical protein